MAQGETIRRYCQAFVSKSLIYSSTLPQRRRFLFDDLRQGHIRTAAMLKGCRVSEGSVTFQHNVDTVNVMALTHFNTLTNIFNVCVDTERFYIFYDAHDFETVCLTH